MTLYKAKCPECGGFFTETSPNSFVCENGCGKIQTKATLRELSLSQAATAIKIEAMTMARYRIDGMPGIWVCGLKVPHAVAAHIGDNRNLRWFVRDATLEREVALAMGFDVGGKNSR